MKSLLVFIVVLLNGCVSLFPPPTPPQDCDTKVENLINNDIGPNKECVKIVEQKAIASGPNVPTSVRITMVCKNSLEVVAVINKHDFKLQQMVLMAPKVKKHGECVLDKELYDVYSSSIQLREASL